MPDNNGLQLAQAIREDRELTRLQLVLVSSAGIDLPRQRLRQLGITAQLHKPVRQQHLCRCLCNVIGSPLPMDAGAAQPRDDAMELRGRVLLAEDNLVNQEVAVAMLEKYSIEVLIANDGSEALELVQQQPVDVVLMDCHMPVMDGFAASSAIREWEAQQGAQARVPIIALTADVQKGIEQRCQEAGMDDYLSKPFNQRALFERLQRWLPEVVDTAAADANDSAQNTAGDLLDPEPLAPAARAQQRRSRCARPRDWSLSGTGTEAGRRGAGGIGPPARRTPCVSRRTA